MGSVCGWGGGMFATPPRFSFRPSFGFRPFCVKGERRRDDTPNNASASEATARPPTTRSHPMPTSPQMTAENAILALDSLDLSADQSTLNPNAPAFVPSWHVDDDEGALLDDARKVFHHLATVNDSDSLGEAKGGWAPTPTSGPRTAPSTSPTSPTRASPPSTIARRTCSTASTSRPTSRRGTRRVARARTTERRGRAARG